MKPSIHTVNTYVLIVSSLLLLSLLPHMSLASNLPDKRQITIDKTAPIKNNALVSGKLSLEKKQLNFTGKFVFQSKDEKIFIDWFSVNKKKFSPYFKSVFKTNDPSLKKGQKLYIAGDFDRLLKKLKAAARDSDLGEAPDALDSKGGSNSFGSTGTSSGQSDAGSAANSSGSTTATTPAATPPSTETEVSVSSSADESCPHEISGSKIHIKSKKVTTYSDGSLSEEPCRTVSTYDLVSTFEGCSPRHDHVQAITYLQQKQGYVNDEGNFILTKSCHDTHTTFVHQKIASSCDEHYDKQNNLIYQSKKTYYVDTNGNMHFISDCQIDSTTFRAVSSDDYLKEFSVSDRIDLTSKMAFKRFKYYIQLGAKKEYVSDWQDDLTNPMPIFKDYESCTYFHDINSAKSLRQYQLVYHSSGQKKAVSECRGDPALSFAHHTDDKFCTPEIINRKIYKKTSTYFLDETQKRIVVSDCALTDQEQEIDPAYLFKNYSKCKPRIDFGQMRAVASYIEEVSLGTQSKEVSTCTEDISTFYPLSETDVGCSYRIDIPNSRAILQRRLFYNDGTENVYVSECSDTDITTSLVKTADSCVPQVKGDQLVEYNETYYINANGDKKVVVACSPSDITLPITEDIKIYDYDSCPDSINIADMKAYQRFKTYVDVMGNKTLLKSCTIDPLKYYTIVETPVACSVRHDFTSGLSVVQNRLIYIGRAGQETEVRPCYDTPKKFNHHKMVDTCAPVYDSENNVTFDTKKTYYLDDNSNVNFISACMIDVSTSKAVISSDKKKEFLHDDTIDFENGVAFKRYREYIVLSGDAKEYVSPVMDDLSAPMPISREYACPFFNDNVAGVSYRQFQEVYYRDGARKVVSDCQKDTTKSFTHITDNKFCIPQITNKLVYTKESTYFLDETSQRVVVKECALNGQQETLDPSLIEKNYDVCSPRLDFVNMVAISAYKEQVIFDETVKNLSDCTEDPEKTFAISETDSGCEYRVDLSSAKAIAQKRMMYNTGFKTFYITACQDSAFEFPFIKSAAICAPTITDDGLSFNKMEETYFIDGSGVKRTVIGCSPTGVTELIPDASKIKDFSKCEPEIVVDEMAAYGKYQLYAKAGAENILIQDCTVDPSVVYAIDEDFASCPVKLDTVNNVAIQYKKLFYKKGNEDVYVSACIESDTTYSIQESVTGCSYRVDMANKTAIAQKRQYYDSGGSINYTTECYDTPLTTPIVASTELCPQNLSDDGLFLIEAQDAHYTNHLGEKIIVQECTPTGNLIPVPDNKKIRNYENCEYLVDMPNNKVNPQYQLFVHHGNDVVMIQGCTPDFDTEYALLPDFSDCDAKIDFVAGEATETVKYFFKQGVEDVFVTKCIESDTVYPIESRTDICEVLPIENDPANVIQQQRLYYLDSQNQIQYISSCEPTDNVLAVTNPVCSGSNRYIHNYTVGQSFIAVLSKYGEQVIEDCHISPNHAAMTHYEESCGWTHDNSKYRSTMQLRAYIKDSVTNAKVYLDSCHASQLYVSYIFNGDVVINNNNGGNPGNCDAGLYWGGTITGNYCRQWLNSADKYFAWTVIELENGATTLNALKDGTYKGVFRRYQRPDNTYYDVWYKNQCGIRNPKILDGEYTLNTFTLFNHCPEDPPIYNASTRDSASSFGVKYLDWVPY